MEYKVISSRCLGKFNAELKAHIESGWVPDGEVVVSAISHVIPERDYSEGYSYRPADSYIATTYSQRLKREAK